MRSYNELLQIHALNDLTNRARSGIFMYLAVWLAVAFTFDIYDTHTSFFALNTAIIIAIIAIRLSHLFVVSRKTGEKNIPRLMQWLVTALLLAALHWGAMSAWIIYDNSLNHALLVTLIILPTFAVGGASTLSISSEIRILYPTLMLAPPIATFVTKQSNDSLMLAALCSIALLYVFASTRVSHRDYWEAITNHMVAEERAELMEQLSITDTLTQLKNRMFFDAEYNREWKRSARLKCPLSVIMIDVDFFKKVNDNYGHMFGDECLKAIANAINSEAKRPSDCVARYGGEEFVALLPNTDQKGAEALSESMLAAIRKISLKAEGQAIKLTCSIGGATCIPNNSTEKSSLIRQADTALYLAKNAGRDQYQSDDDADS